jgi:hypothetical protein
MEMNKLFSRMELYTRMVTGKSQTPSVLGKRFDVRYVIALHVR